MTTTTMMMMEFRLFNIHNNPQSNTNLWCIIYNFTRGAGGETTTTTCVVVEDARMVGQQYYTIHHHIQVTDEVGRHAAAAIGNRQQWSFNAIDKEDGFFAHISSVRHNNFAHDGSYPPHHSQYVVVHMVEWAIILCVATNIIVHETTIERKR